jgi:hypothetical protein
MTWQSLTICLGCALVAVGYAAYLAAFRKDLRLSAGEDPEPAAAPPMRTCPGCGVQVDSRTSKCPLCGAEKSES